MSTVEIGQSSADAEVWPKNWAECSARQHMAIRHSVSFVAPHLWRFALAAGIN